MKFKSGFVAILGEPNVGKSTLINALLGEKVAIVSPKPQTTRNKIIGILNRPDCQIIFIDTPGMHPSKNKLDEFMQKSIDSAREGVDVNIIVLDGTKPFTEKRLKFVESFDYSNTILVINKIDQTTFETMYPKLATLNAFKHIKDIVPLSALRGKNIDILIEIIKSHLPEGVKYFDDDVFTDKSERFLVSEIIREKALWLLQDEIPHGIAVDIIDYKEGDVYDISADIICEKKGHKSIIIGKDGEMLKLIGSHAREDIEKMVGHQVMLRLFVKVRADWRNNNLYIKNLGYKPDEF